jgi:hypothetical protein
VGRCRQAIPDGAFSNTSFVSVSDQSLGPGLERPNARTARTVQLREDTVDGRSQPCRQFRGPGQGSQQRHRDLSQLDDTLAVPLGVLPLPAVRRRGVPSLPMTRRQISASRSRSPILRRPATSRGSVRPAVPR